MFARSVRQFICFRFGWKHGTYCLPWNPLSHEQGTWNWISAGIVNAERTHTHNTRESIIHNFQCVQWLYDNVWKFVNERLLLREIPIIRYCQRVCRKTGEMREPVGRVLPHGHSLCYLHEAYARRGAFDVNQDHCFWQQSLFLILSTLFPGHFYDWLAFDRRINNKYITSVRSSTVYMSTRSCWEPASEFARRSAPVCVQTCLSLRPYLCRSTRIVFISLVLDYPTAKLSIVFFRKMIAIFIAMHELFRCVDRLDIKTVFFTILALIIITLAL